MMARPPTMLAATLAASLAAPGCGDNDASAVDALAVDGPLPICSTTPLASDDFNRTVDLGWGIASDGRTWQTSYGDGVLGVDGERGVVRRATSDFTEMKLADMSGDVEVRVTGTLSSDDDDYFGIFIKYDGDVPSYYSVTVGNGYIVLSSSEGCPGSDCADLFSVTPGVAYRAALRSVGTTLSAKVWEAGSAEPSQWRFGIVDDSQFTSTGVGVAAHLPAVGGQQMAFDDFVACQPAP